MENTFFLRLFWVIAAETIVDFLLFPVWWYTKGLVRTARGVFYAIAHRWYNLGLGLWIKNIFRPMYGQEDFQGRLISLFFRILVLGWRSVLFLLALLFFIGAFLIYLVAPLAILYGIVRSFS